MIEVAKAISNFPAEQRIQIGAAPSEHIDFVQNSTPLISLTRDQLKVLIQEAVTEATAPLLDRIISLEKRITDLETQQLQDIDRVCLDVAQDRQRISKLEQRQTTPTSAPSRGEKAKARVAKIDEILKTRGPTTLKELERILKISAKEMNRILNRLDKRRYELHTRPGDERQKVLKLKSQIP